MPGLRNRAPRGPPPVQLPSWDGVRDDDDEAVVEFRRLVSWIRYCHRVFYGMLDRLTLWLHRLASDGRVSDMEWVEAYDLVLSYAVYGQGTYTRATEHLRREFLNVAEAEQHGGVITRNAALRRMNSYWNGEYPPDCECQYCMYSRDVIAHSISRSWSIASVEFHQQLRHMAVPLNPADRQSQHFHQRIMLARHINDVNMEARNLLDVNTRNLNPNRPPCPYYLLRARIRAALPLPRPRPLLD